MATAASLSLLERFRSVPLRGLPLAAVVLVVWVAGALYCSGYEALATGYDNWPGSLIWSAAAVLPWLALFEWSKSGPGRRVLSRWSGLAAVLVGTAAASLLLEFAANALAGDPQTPILLALMRRLPAIGISLILVLWAQAAGPSTYEPDPELDALAASIDWLSAADNYVELRMGGRLVMRRMTMREAERALTHRGFVRIHRRYLVNREQIVAVRGNGAKTVRLRGGTELPVGSRYAANLKSFATSPQSG